jgi:hypothetical protein
VLVLACALKAKPLPNRSAKKEGNIRPDLACFMFRFIMLVSLMEASNQMVAGQVSNEISLKLWTCKLMLTCRIHLSSHRHMGSYHQVRRP